MGGADGGGGRYQRGWPLFSGVSVSRFFYLSASSRACPRGPLARLVGCCRSQHADAGQNGRSFQTAHLHFNQSWFLTPWFRDRCSVRSVSTTNDSHSKCRRTNKRIFQFFFFFWKMRHLVLAAVFLLLAHSFGAPSSANNKGKNSTNQCGKGKSRAPGNKEKMLEGGRVSPPRKTCGGAPPLYF